MKGSSRVLRGSLAWLFLALAVVLGQQAVLLHDLGHATERHDGTPAEKKSCDQHSLCLQLGGAVASSPPVLPIAEAGATHVAAAGFRGASQRARLAYRSQAPPGRTSA